MIKRFLISLILAAYLSSPTLAFPLPIPAAGVVERELEKEYVAQPFEVTDKIPAIQIDLPEEKLEFPEGVKVLISAVKITGNECIADQAITNWLEGCLDQELSIQDIYGMCVIVDQCYAKEGYILARAYPPPQTIENGVLSIAIIEGKLGNIEVVGNRYYNEAFIRGYFSSLQGKPLNYDEFLHALLLVNENMDLYVQAVFKKGEEFGTGDVILDVEDEYPAHLYLNANNYGRKLTTNTRFGGRLDWGNFIVDGDKFSVAEVKGLPINALNFTDLNYTLPLNKKGTSLELAYLNSRFQIDELERLHLSGQSDIATVKVNHAWIRDRNLSVDLFSYFDFKQIQNFVLKHRTSFDKLRVLTFGSLFDYFDPYRGRDSLSLRLGVGIPDFLGGLKAVDHECSRHGGGGRFVVLNADYDRLQLLPKDCFLYLHGSGQWSPNKLALPEQFYIGGDDTVRGYPLAVALGDSGYCVNCEFRFPPPYFADKNFFMLDKTWKEIIQFDLFIDNGAVFYNSGRSIVLWGTGMGLRVNGPYSLTCSIDVGFPLNHKRLTSNAFVYIKLTAQPF